MIVVANRQNRQNTTGTKFDTPLVETPQAISVVNSDQLDTIKAVTLSDALNYMPGMLSQSASNARYADQVTIRGFLADPAFGNFLRDGLKLPSNLYDGSQEPYGLERVEVLRGVSSVHAVRRLRELRIRPVPTGRQCPKHRRQDLLLLQRRLVLSLR